MDSKFLFWLILSLLELSGNSNFLLIKLNGDFWRKGNNLLEERRRQTSSSLTGRVKQQFHQGKKFVSEDPNFNRQHKFASEDRNFNQQNKFVSEDQNRKFQEGYQHKMPPVPWSNQRPKPNNNFGVRQPQYNFQQQQLWNEQSMRWKSQKAKPKGFPPIHDSRYVSQEVDYPGSFQQQRKRKPAFSFDERRELKYSNVGKNTTQHNFKQQPNLEDESKSMNWQKTLMEILSIILEEKIGSREKNYDEPDYTLLLDSLHQQRPVKDERKSKPDENENLEWSSLIDPESLEDISNEMSLPPMKPKKHPKNEPLFLKQLKTRNSEASCEDEKEVFSNDIGKHSKQNVSIYFVN